MEKEQCKCEKQHAHEHHHEHHHEHGELHGQLWQIGIAAVLLVAAVMVEKCFPGLTTWQLLLVYLVPYLVAGHCTMREA